MKPLMVLVGVVCLAFMLLPSCAPAPEPTAEEAPSTEADVAAIKALNQQCVAALNAGELEEVVALFSDDVVFMAPNEPAITGKNASRSWLQADMDKYTFEETWYPEEIVVFGDWAFDRGSFAATMTPKEGGEPVTDKGTYIWILRRQPDGAWRYARCIWNSDNPLPEAPTT